MRTTLRLLAAGSLVALSTLASASPSFAWSPYQSYSSSTPTTRQQACSYTYFYSGAVLYMKNTCTGQVYPALR